MVNVWSILVVVFASLLKGITGFGFALVSLPFLMIWYSPKELIPVLMMCNLIASIFIVLQKKKAPLINQNFKNLIIYGGVFSIGGALTLSVIKESYLIHILAILFIILSGVSLLNMKHQIKISKCSYKLVGSAIGFLAGTISVSGPPLALLLNMMKVSNVEFREIFSWFNIVTATIAIIGYASIGLITPEVLKMTLTFIPILLLGTITGKRLNHILPQLLFKKITIGITIVACIMLLIK